MVWVDSEDQLGRGHQHLILNVLLHGAAHRSRASLWSSTGSVQNKVMLMLGTGGAGQELSKERGSCEH